MRRGIRVARDNAFWAELLLGWSLRDVGGGLGGGEKAELGGGSEPEVELLLVEITCSGRGLGAGRRQC